jgi:large subunit ribosomal protein L19
MGTDAPRALGDQPRIFGTAIPKLEEALMNVVDSLRKEGLRDDLPDFNIGDTVVISVRIQEGGKTRIQAFEGVVISRRGTGLEASIMVRKISSGIAVERVFPLESPNLSAIKVVKRGRVRRAKLYYLRGRTGRRARIREAPRK